MQFIWQAWELSIVIIEADGRTFLVWLYAFVYFAWLFNFTAKCHQFPGFIDIDGMEFSYFFTHFLQTLILPGVAILIRDCYLDRDKGDHHYFIPWKPEISNFKMSNIKQQKMDSVILLRIK